MDDLSSVSFEPFDVFVGVLEVVTPSTLLSREKARSAEDTFQYQTISYRQIEGDLRLPN
jgi:hypothetical protein